MVGSINVGSAPAAGAPWPCLTSGWCLSRCDNILLATCDVNAGLITYSSSEGREGERVKRERETERECVCVCVCVRERERERERPVVVVVSHTRCDVVPITEAGSSSHTKNPS